MNFHDNKLWQQSYVVLMDLYSMVDDLDEETHTEEAEVIGDLLDSAQQITARIADGLSRVDHRFGKNLIFDSVGLVAVVRTQLAIAWGRGIVDDEEFKTLDNKYQELTLALQNFK